MIFAAGLGTRFKPWTDNHPKALAEVNGRSLLQRNVEYLHQYGITNVIVNVHHFGEQIKEAVAKSKGWGSNITISDETSEVLETGGGLMKAMELLKERGPFLTMNADILTNLNLRDFYDFHSKNKALITLAVSQRETSRYFLFDEDNRLCGWRNVLTGTEKISIIKGSFIQKAFSGIAIFQPEVFGLIRQSGKFSLVDSFLDLAAENIIMGFDHSGDKFIDVGKPDSVQLAESIFD